MASNCQFLFCLSLVLRLVLWSSLKVEEDGDEWKNQFAALFSNPTVLVIDHPESIEKLPDRVTILEALKSPPKEETVCVSKQAVLDDLESLSGQDLGLSFPMVLREFMSHGKVVFKVHIAGELVKEERLRRRLHRSQEISLLQYCATAVRYWIRNQFGSSKNSEFFVSEIELVLFLYITMNQSSPAKHVPVDYLGYYGIISMNWGWSDCLVMHFEDWKAHKWKEKRGENGGDEHSTGFLLEGCLKARDTKAELIKSPNALLLSCGDLSYLCAEPSGVQNCQVPWFASFAVVLGDFISVRNLMRVIKALIHCLNFWEIMKLVTVGLVQGSNNVYKYRLNQHLTKIWPCVNEAASELIKANVEPIMDQYRPVILSSLKFSQFTLGTVAPQFTGISIIKDGGVGGITMELEMNWDGDNGYGNAMNVKRTVKGFIRAGFAGIILEDQVSPKACGHTQGRKLNPTDWRRLLTHGILCSGSIFHRCVHYDGNSQLVYLNGVVHWMGESYRMILSFDMANEVCGSIGVPSSLAATVELVHLKTEFMSILAQDDQDSVRLYQRAAIMNAALAVLFLWSNATTFLNKSPPKFPEVLLPLVLFTSFVSVLEAFMLLLESSVLSILQPCWLLITYIFLSSAICCLSFASILVAYIETSVFLSGEFCPLYFAAVLVADYMSKLKRFLE